MHPGCTASELPREEFKREVERHLTGNWESHKSSSTSHGRDEWACRSAARTALFTIRLSSLLDFCIHSPRREHQAPTQQCRRSAKNKYAARHFWTILTVNVRKGFVALGKPAMHLRATPLFWDKNDRREGIVKSRRRSVGFPCGPRLLFIAAPSQGLIRGLSHARTCFSSRSCAIWVRTWRGFASQWQKSSTRRTGRGDGAAVRALSTDTVQRLSLARALMHEPQVLLLDERTRSLDPLAVAELHSFLREDVLGQCGATLLFASRSLFEVERLALQLGRIT